MSNDLQNRFSHHPPATPERAQAHERTRAIFLQTACELAAVVPAGREQALMLTKLEEAMFWANAGIARQPQV